MKVFHSTLMLAVTMAAMIGCAAAEAQMEPLPNAPTTTEDIAEGAKTIEGSLTFQCWTGAQVNTEFKNLQHATLLEVGWEFKQFTGIGDEVILFHYVQRPGEACWVHKEKK